MFYLYKISILIILNKDILLLKFFESMIFIQNYLQFFICCI